MDAILGPQEIYGADEFETLMASERARLQRYGTSFSVIAFRPAHQPVDERHVRSLHSALRRRVRATDRVAWVADGSLAVLLAEADEAGARRVADDVCARLKGKRAVSVSIRHYTPDRVADSSTAL